MDINKWLDAPINTETDFIKSKKPDELKIQLAKKKIEKQKQQDAEAYMGFISELKEVSKKWNVTIGYEGCCGEYHLTRGNSDKIKTDYEGIISWK